MADGIDGGDVLFEGREESLDLKREWEFWSIVCDLFQESRWRTFVLFLICLCVFPSTCKGGLWCNFFHVSFNKMDQCLNWLLIV